MNFQRDIEQAARDAFVYPRNMHSASVFFAGCLAASLCLSSSAQTMDQSYGSQQQPAPTAQAPAAPSSTPQLKLESLPPDPHTPTPEEKAAAEAAVQRAQVQRIAAAMANWGPKASSPGITLTLKEMSREKAAAGTMITYHLLANGFAPGTRLTLLRWLLNQNVTAVLNGIVIDASGTAVCAPPAPASAAPRAPASGTAESGTAASGTAVSNPSSAAAPAATPAVPDCTKTMQPNAPVEITTATARGEAVRVGLIAEDKKSGAAASVVPFPITGEDRGCKLEVVLGARDAELVLIEGNGFKPDVSFTAGTETFGEKTSLAAKPDAQGHFVAAMTPYVQGHDSGNTVIYYQSQACTPTVSFHWGKDSYKAE